MDQALPGLEDIKSNLGKRGRKNSDGTEETIKIKPIQDAVKDAMKLYRKFDAAKIDFNECIKGIAERSNANASTIKKLISSSYKGKFEDARRMVEQQSVIFESVGEVPSGAVTGN